MGLGARITAALAWIAGGRVIGQLVTWCVTLVVIRILEPADYGLLAMSTVLIGFMQLFAALGLGGAVVYAQEVDHATLRRVFGLSLVVNGALFAIACAAAPLIAAFFGEPRLTRLIPAMAIVLLIGAVSVVPSSMIQRGLEFKWRSIVDLSGTVLGAGSTLGFALAGFGVWALVCGTLIGVVWRAIGVQLIHPFPHLPSFSLKGMGKMIAFGGYVSLARLLLYVQLQADMIVGGRVLGKEQVGYYSVAMDLASMPMQRISIILNEVAFPAFARIRDERARVSAYLLQAVRLLSLLSFSAFWGIAAVAPEIVSVVLGDKWQPATVPLQLLALATPLRMIGQLMPPTLHGMGRAKLVARNQLFACAVLIPAFLIGVRFGVVGLAFAWVVAFPMVFLANMRTWLPVVGLSAGRLLGAMARPALAGAGMFAAVTLARALEPVRGLPLLLVLILVGAASFGALSWIFNRDGLRELAALRQHLRPGAAAGDAGDRGR